VGQNQQKSAGGIGTVRSTIKELESGTINTSGTPSSPILNGGSSNGAHSGMPSPGFCGTSKGGPKRKAD